MHKELAENIEKMEDMTYGDGEIEEKEEERSCEFSYILNFPSRYF